MLRFTVVFLFAFCTFSRAQVPSETILDTAAMRQMREQKIMYKYSISVPFDSVTGKLTEGAKPDTTYWKYDRMGREIEFSYVNNEKKRWHIYSFFDTNGKLVRKFSCNTDSTDGFIDYWTYNSKGQVVKEVSCDRAGSAEVIFHYQEFDYDDSGRLATHREYYPDDTEPSKYSQYSYSGEYVIRISFGTKGDTNYLDSSRIHSIALRDGYYSARYNYNRSWDGKYSRTLVSKFTSVNENLGSRKRRTTLSSFYDYGSGKLRLQYTDTTYVDRHDQMIEARYTTGYTKYFWKKDGTLDYFIKYNRKNQPLERTTNAFRYYE
jgi:hypothetical protein